MEYIYAALLLHKAGKEIKEDTVKKVLDATGVAADESRVKALVAALEGVDIEEALANAAPVAAAPAATGTAAPAGDAPAAEAAPKKEEKKPEEAAAGLGALFG